MYRNHAQGGNVATTFALMAIPILGIIGCSVDAIMVVDAKANVQATLDSAVLAGAAKLADGERVAIDAADDYYKSNMTSLAASSASFRVEDGIVYGTASGNYKTGLLSVFGISSISINADSGARDGGTTSSFKGAEIAIVVDVSGSMASSIPSLRAATTKILDTVYGTSNTKPDLWVSIIPFSGRVNVTNYGAAWFNPGQVPAVNQPPTTGSPRVTTASGTRCKENSYLLTAPRLCGARRTGDAQWDNTTHTTQKWNFFRGDAVTCPIPRAIGLEASRSILQSAADNLCAGHGTSTQEGMAWGFRALDPSWRGQWGSETLPLDYDKSPGKIAIIMTDGKNHPGQAGDSLTEAQADAELLKTCTAMKSKGITIYAITYNMGGALKALYAQCTTKPEYSLTAEDGAALEAAFGSIGDMIIEGGGTGSGSLRLIK